MYIWIRMPNIMPCFTLALVSNVTPLFSCSFVPLGIQKYFLSAYKCIKYSLLLLWSYAAVELELVSENGTTGWRGLRSDFINHLEWGAALMPWVSLVGFLQSRDISRKKYVTIDVIKRCSYLQKLLCLLKKAQSLLQFIYGMIKWTSFSQFNKDV